MRTWSTSCIRGWRGLAGARKLQETESKMVEILHILSAHYYICEWQPGWWAWLADLGISASHEALMLSKYMIRLNKYA